MNLRVLVLLAVAVVAGARVVETGRGDELTSREQRLQQQSLELNERAVQFFQQGKYAEAVKLLQESLRMREALYPKDRYPAGHPDLATSLSGLGVLLQAQGQHAKALTFSQRALDMREALYPRNKYPAGHSDIAASLNDLGSLLQAQGEYAKTLTLYQRALDMNQALYPKDKYPQGHSQLAGSLNALGFLLQAQGEYVKALAFYQRALEMREALYPKDKYPAGHYLLAMSLHNLGAVLKDRGEYAKALPYFQRALEMYEALYPKDKYPKGHPQLAGSLNGLGFLLQAQGECAKALTFYQRALDMREALYPKDRYPAGHPDLATSLSNLGVLLQAQGEYAKALTLYQRALEMYEALYPKDKYPKGHPQLATSLHNLGALLKEQGEYAKAFTYYQRALDMNLALYPKDKYPTGHTDLAATLDNLGFLLQSQREYAKALTFFQRVLDMREALYPRDKYPNGHPQLACSLNNLGFLLKALGEYVKALTFYQRALDMNCELINAFLSTAAEAEALNRLAQLPLTRDDYLSISRHLPDSQEAVYGSLYCSKVALFHLLERRRQALLLSDDPACRELDDQLAQTRQTLARLLLAPPGTFPDQARRVQQLNDTKEDLERQLARKLPAFAELQARDALTPGDLLQRLPEGVVVVDLVRYFRFEQDPQKPGKAGQTWTASYLAFVLARGQPLRRVELGPAQPVEQALFDWRRALASRQRGQPSDTGGQHAATLRKLLWEPVARHFPARTETVLLAPDGPLAFLPWAALPGKDKGTVLLEEHSLAVVPSARFVLERLLDKPATSKPAEGLLLAVGGVQYAGEAKALAARKDDLPPLRAAELGTERLRWDDLPGTAKELERVLALKGGRDVRQRRGVEASVSQLLLDLPETRWAHLATHGFFADARFRTALQLDETEMKKGWNGERVGLAARNPLVLSGLVLAGANRKLQEGKDDGILTAEAIAGLRLDKLELAVLSACDTGLGDTGDFKAGLQTVFGRAGGEGVFGLQRAFHVAGTKNVIASLWQADDESAAALMALFYHKLWQERKTPLVALREAQLHLYRHPEAIAVLAGKRGPDFDQEVQRPVEPKPLPETKPGDRAALQLWAGFVLSGLGR